MADVQCIISWTYRESNNSEEASKEAVIAVVTAAMVEHK
jgi:phenylpyruvate tautomerase PptA (4-oxalocrotonate tautomerase family)